MYACERCGKGILVGMNVSHSHRRTKKRSYPNLHKTTLTIGERRQTMRLCTKCLRVVKKQVVMKPEEKPSVNQVGSEVKVTSTLSEDIEKAASKEEKEPAMVAEAKPKS